MMMTDKYLLYPAEGDTDEDEGMTKEEIMRMLADELGYFVVKELM